MPLRAVGWTFNLSASISIAMVLLFDGWIVVSLVRITISNQTIKPSSNQAIKPSKNQAINQFPSAHGIVFWVNNESDGKMIEVKNVLVIDRDEEYTEIFCDAIHELIPGAVCQVAKDIPSLREATANNKTPDFIFSDINRTEEMELIDSTPSFKNIPVVLFCSGSRLLLEELRLNNRSCIIKENSVSEVKNQLAAFFNYV